MNKVWRCFLILFVCSACDSGNEGPSFPRALPITTLYNDVGIGDPGFFVVKSDLQYREIFGQDQSYNHDFTQEMMLIYISNQRSSSESYSAKELIEQDINIVYDINFFPCDPCTRDAVQQVLIIATSQINKPVIPSLVTNN